LFITHLHPDHTVGLADFMIAPWVKHRTEPLHIFGPAGTQKMASLLLEAHQIGIHEHLYGSAPIDEPLEITITDIAAGQIYQDDKVRVIAFRVQHGSLTAFGYKFYTPDKTIVVSGDTCFVPEMIEQAQGCDILVHEVYSSAQLPQRPAGWQQYHSTVHTGTIDLARIANAAQPGKLVLTHQLFWGDSPESLLDEMQTLYSGTIINGHDLMIIE
jgi:ribonuclease BN (tRNA processing enzyme)